MRLANSFFGVLYNEAANDLSCVLSVLHPAHVLHAVWYACHCLCLSLPVQCHASIASLRIFYGMCIAGQSFCYIMVVELGR